MSETVLYVEDEEDYQLLVQRILGKKGFNIQLAGSEEEAMRMLEKISPRLMILDVNLPDADGYSLCRLLRQHPAWKTLPILLLTVRRRPEEWLRGFSSGADDYVLKPLNPPELEERVRSCLALQPSKSTATPRPSSTAEYLLIQAAVAGNRPAFEVLVEQYKMRLMSSLRVAGRTDFDAEDAVAGAFAKAYELLPQFRGESSFYTWLYRIAFNEKPGRSTFETRSLEDIRCLDSFAGASLLRASDSVSDTLSQKNRQIQLNRAVSKIPRKYQQMLKWHFVRGLSYNWMAERLQVPRGTVMSRLFKAKELLRASWNKAGGDAKKTTLRERWLIDSGVRRGVRSNSRRNL